jgi:hypothetical protein
VTASLLLLHLSVFLLALIHRNAWNRDSANFAIKEFCELRLFGDSPKLDFHFTAFSEVRLVTFHTNIAHLGDACPRLGV